MNEGMKKSWAQGIKDTHAYHTMQDTARPVKIVLTIWDCKELGLLYQT